MFSSLFALYHYDKYQKYGLQSLIIFCSRYEFYNRFALKQLFYRFSHLLLYNLPDITQI